MNIAKMLPEQYLQKIDNWVECEVKRLVIEALKKVLHLETKIWRKRLKIRNSTFPNGFQTVAPKNSCIFPKERVFFSS